MKTRIFFLIAMVICSTVMSQTFYQESLIKPINPDSDDSVLISTIVKCNLGVYDICPELGYFTCNIQDTLIELNLYYDYTGLWPLFECFRLDTINIGTFDPGEYTLKLITNKFTYHAPYTNDTTFTYHVDSELHELNISSAAAISESELNGMISVFPLPAKDFLLMEKAERLEIEKMQIINLHGRKIREFPGWKDRLNLAGIEPGVYVLLVWTDRGIINKKVVVE